MRRAFFVKMVVLNNKRVFLEKKELIFYLLFINNILGRDNQI